MALSVAKKAANRAKFWIEKAGQTVTVKRGSVSKTLTCMAQPLTPEDAVRLKIEGDVNIANAMPRNFIFTGEAHVIAGDKGPQEKDLVDDDGQEFRIVNSTPTRVGDIVIMRECIGVRNAEAYRGL